MSPSLVRDNNYNSNSYVNYILVDRYFQSEFSETRFRVMYAEMSMLFREYYATSPKLHLLQTDRKNHLLTVFITWIDADSKYLSIGFNFVQFG